ncbi:MAG: EamA family transporter [Actinobacteria bacterium]|nr:EamA family transporter [Actinomycetota bacterium]
MLAATVLALSSAGLHATWNLLVKTSTARDLAGWGQFLFAGVLVLPALVLIGLPPAGALPYLLASGVIHVAYITALVQAYANGDFSLAYPLARGGGAFFAAIGGVLLLGDVLPALAWVAIAIVAGGMLSLIRPGTSRASIFWALATALTIAVYTLIDSQGSRLAAGLSGTDMASVSYGFALMPVSATAVSIANLARGRGRAFVRSIPANWMRYSVAALLLTSAYTLVLVAVTSAPVGYVTMLRESSVVMGALAGWLFLHERLGKHRFVSSAVIVAGLVLLVTATLT